MTGRALKREREYHSISGEAKYVKALKHSEHPEEVRQQQQRLRLSRELLNDPAQFSQLMSDPANLANAINRMSPADLAKLSSDPAFKDKFDQMRSVMFSQSINDGTNQAFGTAVKALEGAPTQVASAQPNERQYAGVAHEARGGRQPSTPAFTPFTNVG